MSAPVTICKYDDAASVLISQYGFISSIKDNISTLTVPEAFGNGYLKSVQVCNDLTFTITNVEFSRPITMCYENYDNQFETTYCFGGQIGYAETGVIETGLSKNKFGVYIKQQSRGMIMYPSNEKIVAVSILAKGKILESLPQYDTCVTSGDCCYKNLVNDLICPKKANVQLQNMLCRMLSGHDEDMEQPLLMEGIAKTVVATMWQDHVLLALGGNTAVHYSDLDRRAFCAAAAILAQSYAAPPTISELAKMVAVNEHKLKIGFRALYGKTIYEYVQNYRMEVARHLLENEDLTITQIAGMVGYINASHFSGAFRKQYHMNPRDLRNGV